MLYSSVKLVSCDHCQDDALCPSEPWVVSDQGYLHGMLAPGHRDKYEAPIAAHNLMRAHGAAVKAYRDEGKHQIGLVVNAWTGAPMWTS